MELSKVQELLASLTIEEKIGQLIQLNGSFFEEQEEVVTGPMQELGIHQKDIQLAGSILNTVGAKKVKNIQRKYLEQSKKKIPLLFMADIINGYKTTFPIPLGLGCSFDTEMIQDIARIAAQEAATAGIAVTFSPMVDLVRDARWGRVMESFGEDTYLNCQYAKAMVKGYQGKLDEKNNIACCVKHFAGYGAPIGGRDYNSVDMNERTLFQAYLPVYQAAIEAGCEMVMTSFNTIDQIPVTANYKLLHTVLREQWKFRGVVISDYSEIKELIAHGIAEDEKEAAYLAMHAGCDIDMMTSVYVKHLKSLIEEKVLDIQVIDDAVRRVLELKNKLGLFENPYRGADEQLEKERELCCDYRHKARESVQKSCVLLKNNQQLLPLKKDKKIALIGPYSMSKQLNGMWSIYADEKETASVYEGIINHRGIAECAIGAKVLEECAGNQLGLPISQDLEFDEKRELENAIEIAKKAEVIVLALGEHPYQSGEGGSRAELSISDSQLGLLKQMKAIHKPIVVLMFSGRPLDLKIIEENCTALIQCWFPGVEGGNGIADLLFGEANFSARLSMSFPYSVGQCPVYYNHDQTGRPVESVGINRFTSRYLDVPNQPLYCFGYGLSYSIFEYGSIHLDKKYLTKNTFIKASVKVKNISNVKGEETVQLYIRDLKGSVVRPVKELKGIAKITLEPKEEKEVTFKITEEMLRFYTISMTYESEEGSFEVMIGSNSETYNKALFVLQK